MILSTKSTGGGAAVYLQNSKPGDAHGHKFHVYEIEIVNGVEQLDLLLATKTNLDSAMNIAAREA